MKLYEITENYQAFLDLVENDEIPKDTIRDTLDAIKGNFNAKADEIACVIKSLTAEAAAMKAEEDALKKRRLAKEHNIERIEQYLYDNMTALDTRKIETARNVLLIKKNQPSLKVENKDELIAWLTDRGLEDLVKYTPPEVRKDDLKKYMKAHKDVEVPFITMVQGQSLQIK